MHWLLTLDRELFRFVNSSLRNPVFDRLMPFASGNPFFFPALLTLGLVMAWRGERRTWLCALMLALILPLGDGLVTNMLKHALMRPRPFLTLPDVHLLVGRSGSGSMPSSHAANWFAATFIAFIYFRRSIWILLPCGVVVAFSRVYNGVHYPSDVLAGAILGAGYAAAGLWLLDALWFWAGRKWFPLWWEQLPSLLDVRTPPKSSEAEDAEDAPEPHEPKEIPATPTPLPGAFAPKLQRAKQGEGKRDWKSGEQSDSDIRVVQGFNARISDPGQSLPHTRGIAPAGFVPPQATLDTHWLRLGYLLIGLLLVLRWAYLRSGAIQLSEDEAYQWLWSKHLALSYYSKPPLIALIQFLGTSLWGDTAFGVRFFSPVFAAITSLMVLRFFARQVNARAGFFLVVMMNALPLLAAGAIVMTVDALSVMFWTAALVAGWRAVQEKATTRDWLWVGLWMGLGFLGKYTALLQWLCWAVFFALWPAARRQLRKPGPYLALLINLVCAVPVLFWNYQHGWITAIHVADDSGMREAWRPSLRPLLNFIGSEALLLNPVFFVAMIWAGVGFWRRSRRDPRLIYCFSMGAPLFLIYLLLAFRSRVLPNWIAPSVIPLLCLMVIYWDTRWRLGARRLKPWLITGLALGFALAGIGHNTNVVEKITHRYLPVRFDILHRVREWDTTARIVGDARAALLTEGKPVFIITDHYGMAGELSFYSPEARTAAEPMIYFRSSLVPENQFYFWPGYSQRKGENAIFVRELNRDDPRPQPPPASLQTEFDSVTEMGVSNVWYHGRFLLRPLELFACRGLK